MSLFFQSLEDHGNRTALRDAAGRVLTYAQLAAASDRLATSLGPASGVVAIESANTIETVVAYLATLRSNRVALMIDATLRPEAREALYARFAISRVVSGRPTAAGEPVVGRRTASHTTIAPGLALLLSTSGSTGSPKLVRLSANSVDANARSIASYLALSSDERPLASLPLHYSYGLSVLNSHLLVGATVILSEAPVTTREFWSQLRETAATSLTGVPATWDILKQLRLARMDLPSLAYGTQAGGRLSLPTTTYFADWATQTGKRFYVMYGQTEATARIAYVPPERLHEKIGSIGIAIPGGELSLVDANGETITEPEGSGEILYRGPNVMWGYAESREELSRGDDCGGRLRTGDLARRDSEGYYFIIGRLKRFAKVFGNRLNLDDVEAILQRRGIVGAVGQRDDRLLIGVEGADPEHVRQLVCAELQIHQSGVVVQRVPAIPRSAAGKVAYPALEEDIIRMTSTSDASP